MSEVIRKETRVVKMPAQSKDLPATSGPAGYAVALHSIEHDLKSAQERLESLRYAILGQDKGPADLFALLAGNDCRFLAVEEITGSTWITIPLARGCRLVLTPAEYIRGIKRGKTARRREANEKRLGREGNSLEALGDIQRIGEAKLDQLTRLLQEVQGAHAG